MHRPDSRAQTPSSKADLPFLPHHKTVTKAPAQPPGASDPVHSGAPYSISYFGNKMKFQVWVKRRFLENIQYLHLHCKGNMKMGSQPHSNPV